MKSAIAAIIIALSMLTSLRADDAPPHDAERLFSDKVQPLLTSRCVNCHGAAKVEGGLRLDSRKAAIEGGDSGPSLVPGKPSESLLLSAVKHTHKEIKMPPKDKLSAADIAALDRWIRDGAPWPVTTSVGVSVQTGDIIGSAATDARNPIVKLFSGQRLDLWSLKVPQRPAVPVTKDKNWGRNDLDQFVLARLESEGLTPPALADSRTLARRLYFDLSGLPPTSQEMANFAKAVEQTGIEAASGQLVQVLLDSPRYGENFARLWLDVVRYSDSNGFDWDEFRPQAWRFRDYTIRAFNADKPFDQFLREQLAGDELVAGPPRTAAEQDALIATGYLRLGPYDNAAGLFDEQDRSRAELLADVTETTATAFLGMTLGCCRCHDHKYDPLSQADHYRFRAFFAPLRFADDLPLNLAPEQSTIHQLNEKLDAQIKPLRERLDALSPDETMREKLHSEIQALEKQRHPLMHGLLATDNTENIAETRILFQGDHKSPRDSVAAGFFSVLDPQPVSISKATNPQTSGRRLTLANWIASAQNPLTARVFVNRVWQRLMGRPLVPTPNDFGWAGGRPEDAALLDWLATEFVRQNWSVKKLVRLIVLSATYRQAPAFPAEHFSQRSPRRLSAEQLRDALLAVSGLLTAKSAGPAIWPDLPAEVLNTNPAFLDDNELKVKGWYPSPKAEQYARTIFLIQKRTTRVPLLETFDLPDNSVPCARRDVSTVAPQAHALLNSDLARDAALAFATRVQRAADNDQTRQVRTAFQIALQRLPDADESSRCQDFLTQRPLADLCRVLLNLNEFVYVE